MITYYLHLISYLAHSPFVWFLLLMVVTFTVLAAREEK